MGMLVQTPASNFYGPSAGASSPAASAAPVGVYASGQYQGGASGSVGAHASGPLWFLAIVGAALLLLHLDGGA